MTTTADLERALATAGLTAPARWYERIGSTNAEAVAWAERGAEEFSIVAAGHQSAGRGRRGRAWVDAPGGALMFSFVLRPRLDPEDAGLLPLLAGAATAEAARSVAGVILGCWWPNDLLLGNAKAGGILVESSIRGGRLASVVIGVGVNLVAPSEVPGSTGIGADVDPIELLGGFLERFADGYRGQGENLADRVRDRWRAVSTTLGREVAATMTDGSVIRGTAVDIDPSGGLVVAAAAGRIVVRTGELERIG